MIKLGYKVRDKVNGYEGTVTGLVQYAYAADCALVDAIDTTGRPVSTWIEIERLEVTD